MKPFADASFLVAFCCASDGHARKADIWWHGRQCIMFTSRLALFEAENSVRVMHASRTITADAMHAALENLKRALLEGFIELWEVPVRRLYPDARRLSQRHNRDKGHGALDILHVASALDMRCDMLLSFDHAQRELAVAEGMKTAP